MDKTEKEIKKLTKAIAAELRKRGAKVGHGPNLRLINGHQLRIEVTEIYAERSWKRDAPLLRVSWGGDRRSGERRQSKRNRADGTYPVEDIATELLAYAKRQAARHADALDYAKAKRASRKLANAVSRKTGIEKLNEEPYVRDAEVRPTVEVRYEDDEDLDGEYVSDFVQLNLKLTLDPDAAEKILRFVKRVKKATL
jgi:hypothetical protein